MALLLLPSDGSVVPRARVALAGPRREDQEQARVGGGADLVTLVRVEDRERPGRRGDPRAVLLDLHLAVEDDQVRALVDLVVLQGLSRRQAAHDRASLAADGLQDLRLVRLDVERPEVPVLHGRGRYPSAAALSRATAWRMI